MELSMRYGGSDSEEDEDGDLFELHVSVPAVQAPLPSHTPQDSDFEVTLQELLPMPVAPPVAVPVLASPPRAAQPTASTGQPQPGRKRRRAASPESLLNDTRRIRIENFNVVLANLSLETQDMICRAAELGLDRSDPRPRAINRRHVVSEEYPVPQEVITYSKNAFKLTR